MLRVENIVYSLRKGRQILKGFDFQAKGGEVVAILGPNGAGKSTFLNVISGALNASQGSVELHGRALKSFKGEELARHRAVLSQSYSISADFKVEDIVMMGRFPYMNGYSTQKDHELVDHCLELTGTLNLKGRSILSLSGGEQQRVHLARVLAQLRSGATGGGLLLLDEPVSSLDIQYQHSVLQLARDVAGLGHCVITVLHDLNLAARYADRIVILKDGKKYADGTPQESLVPELLSAVYGFPLRVIRHEGELLVLEDCKHTPTMPLTITENNLQFKEA